MYCPRQNTDYSPSNAIAIPITNKYPQSQHIEYNLTTQNSGPLSSSPPNLWCQRLQTRLENY